MAKTPRRGRSTGPGADKAPQEGRGDQPIRAGSVPLPPPDDRVIPISAVAGRARPTGRKLVLLPASDVSRAAETLRDKAGLRVQSRSETGAAAPPEGAAVLLPRLGVAVAAADPDQAAALGSLAGEGTAGPFRTEDEFFLYAAGMDPSWLRGYRDAVVHIARTMLEEEADGGTAEPQELATAGTPTATWGVRLTGCDRSGYAGKGVRIAVLDTGFDPGHPDFCNRPVTSKSFIDGETVLDRNGHGTHVAGIACCGGAPAATQTRYGAAGATELYVGKVLSDTGEGPELAILSGIEWAIENGCRVVNLSLGTQAAPSALFTQVGKRALDAGTLLVAAAGNDSNRPYRVLPVSYPANSPTILAVAAVDRSGRVARFSNGAVGEAAVNLAGPGVGVYSAWVGHRLYTQLSGTSQATPFVAGIACLLLEAKPHLSASEVWSALERLAVPLPGGGAEAVGRGLVRAP